MTPLSDCGLRISDCGFGFRKWYGPVLDEENIWEEHPKSAEDFIPQSAIRNPQF